MFIINSYWKCIIAFEKAWFMHMPSYLSIYLSICLSLCMFDLCLCYRCLCLPLTTSVTNWLSLSALCLSVCLPHSLSPHTHKHIYIYIYTRTHTDIQTHTHTHTHTHIYIYVCVCWCVCVYIYIYICVCVCVCVCKRFFWLLRIAHNVFMSLSISLSMWTSRRNYRLSLT